MSEKPEEAIAAPDAEVSMLKTMLSACEASEKHAGNPCNGPVCISFTRNHGLALVARIENDAKTIEALAGTGFPSGCADGHSPIRYQSEGCPLCAAMEETERIEDLIVRMEMTEATLGAAMERGCPADTEADLAEEETQARDEILAEARGIRDRRDFSVIAAIHAAKEEKS